ncbi:MFS transporter [Oricola sp.]|uniref:MFS transporter n=1 Tax=Oricola sp. TaxID=1979950 RepID=UPI003BAAC613
MIQHVVPIAGLLASTYLLLAGNGLVSVLLPVRASIEDWSAIAVGWVGFGYALSFTAGCLIVPRMVLRVGHVRVYAVMAALSAISVLLCALFVHPLTWVLFRGIGGFALAGCYMIVESWLNERTANEIRGQVFSIYMVVSMVGMSSGQLLLSADDPTKAVLFMVAALLFTAAVIPTGLSNATSPRPLSQVSVDMRSLFRNSPLAFVGTTTVGFIIGAFMFQMPVFFEQNGVAESRIATLMALAMIGGMIFQFPLGRMSDRMDRRYVILLAAALGLISCVLLTLLAGGSLVVFAALILLLGGVMAPLYSLLVAHANDHAGSDEFVEIASGLLIVYGAGSMAGPVVSGLIMDAVGINGFFITLAACYFGFAAFTAWRMFRREAVPPEETTDFAYTPPVPSTHTPEMIQLDPRAEEAAE